MTVKMTRHWNAGITTTLSARASTRLLPDHIVRSGVDTVQENQHHVKIRIQIVLSSDKMCAETQIFRDTYGKTVANSVHIAQCLLLPQRQRHQWRHQSQQMRHLQQRQWHQLKLENQQRCPLAQIVKMSGTIARTIFTHVLESSKRGPSKTACAAADTA